MNIYWVRDIIRKWKNLVCLEAPLISFACQTYTNMQQGWQLQFFDRMENSFRVAIKLTIRSYKTCHRNNITILMISSWKKCRTCYKNYIYKEKCNNSMMGYTNISCHIFQMGLILIWLSNQPWYMMISIIYLQ